MKLTIEEIPDPTTIMGGAWSAAIGRAI